MASEGGAECDEDNNTGLLTDVDCGLPIARQFAENTDTPGALDPPQVTHLLPSPASTKHPAGPLPHGSESEHLNHLRTPSVDGCDPRPLSRRNTRYAAGSASTLKLTNS